MNKKITGYEDNRFSIQLEDGIIMIIYKKSHVDYEYVNDMVNKRLEISGDNSYPMFSDFRKVKEGTREARQRFAERDAGIGVSAVAILIRSKVHMIMYNFFHSVYSAPAPTKLFTNRDDALKWLEKYKK